MSSRICVKNIPKYVNEDKLREFFSQKGEVTDAKIVRTRDGKSRQFCFIGFRTEKEAEDAIKFFDRSYLDTCRITCEVAYKVGDPNIPRPWSKHTVKKSKELDGNKDSNVGIPDNGGSNHKGEVHGTENIPQKKLETEPKLQEFLQVMQPRFNSKLWANDTMDQSSVGGNMEINGKKSDPKKQKSKLNKTDNHIAKQTSDDVGSDDMNGTEKDSLQNSIIDGISDKDYLKSRISNNWSDTESDNDDGKEHDKHDNVTVGDDLMKPTGSQQDERKEYFEDVIDENHELEKAPPALQDENEQVLDNGRLFVRNLPFDTNEDELLELFSKYGDVSHVHLVIDKDTKRSKGFGYVLYALPESAQRALTELDNSSFQGRLLHVFPAKPQNLVNEKSSPVTGRGATSFKEQRQERKRAAEVGGDTKSWNSLFMRPDTVVENIARKYGVSKSDFLDREADDLAVRIALGETHVIAETKKALSNAGINVVALEEFASKKADHRGRSNHVILVKNLPFSSSEGDLVRMFEKFGSLDKIIFPPTKALALVVFLEPVEARAAFRGLAYKCYKDTPLYLEWAPSNILSPNPALEIDKTNIIGENRALLERTVEGEAELDPDRTESRSIFVKNLNFKTSDEALKKHFNDIVKKGKILSVKIKRHMKNGKNLSMGYGFIEFDSSETAAEACKDFQGTVLDGHALILQLCNTKKDFLPAKNIEKDSSSTKLIVRNVAFEATEKDLRQLFSPFGQVKSIRLPMKIGSHRGFAFVEYITKQEAQNAMQALSNTHFYGRHLVLERAKEGESLDELRARTAERFLESEGGPQKLSKKRKLVAVADEGGVKFESVMD